MIQYVSTRGRAPVLNFCDATLAGLAEDGGLYVPDACPKISDVEIANMANQHYLEVAWRVILPFVNDEIAPGELIKILQRAYRGFDAPDIAPLRPFGEGLYLMELFHGPTLAFKDVALQFLGEVFDDILEKKARRVTIVGATSGDTGSAAIEAFQGKAHADVFILHPHGRVSEVQRRQMTTVTAANVHNIAIEGSFDDCQDIVKAMFNDPSFRADMHLSAVNSINWARILAQVVYYVYAAARLSAKEGRPVSFCVPTGNFGNIYAGYVAKSMGAPIDRLIAATNANDILHRFFDSGRMARGQVTPTISPSMDIQVSSNFERLLFDMFGRQGKLVSQTMDHFRQAGPFNVDAAVMEEVRRTFASGRKDDAETRDVMARALRQHDYVLDPHSAIGVGVAEDYLAAHPGSLVVSLATAHAAKFPQAVQAATGRLPPLPPSMADLMERREKYDVLPNDAAQVMDYVRARAGGKGA